MTPFICNEEDLEVLALTIYGEARGEYNRLDGGIASFIAIANIARNRLKEPSRFGHTVQEVCKRKWQFSCWNESDPNKKIINSPAIINDPLYAQAKCVAEKVMHNDWPDLTKGANHYYAVWLTPLPKWAVGRKHTIRIGQHIFLNI